MSDKLQSETKKEEIDSAEVDHRILRGVIRTGVLGDRLLINSDRQIYAALMCKDIPTVSLLQSITSLFIENIEVNSKLRYLQISTFRTKSCAKRLFWRHALRTVDFWSNLATVK